MYSTLWENSDEQRVWRTSLGVDSQIITEFQGISDFFVLKVKYCSFKLASVLALKQKFPT